MVQKNLKCGCDCGEGNEGNCRKDSELIGGMMNIIDDEDGLNPPVDDIDESGVVGGGKEAQDGNLLSNLEDDFENLSDCVDDLKDGKFKDGMFKLLDKMEALMKKHM